MKKTIFRGSGVAIVTPMKENGKVNYETLGELVEFQIANGTDAIISCGTTGESATLNEEEHAKVVKFTVEKTAGRVPVIAGAGSNDTEKALSLSQEAKSLGANAVLVVTPYYNKTSQSGIIKHYNYIADRVDIPMIVYNVPSRTGVNIKPETYLELSKHQNICATKEANGDISSVAQTISLCGEDLAVYSGNDDQTVPVLSLGGIGVISVFSNICPKQCHNMVLEYLKGNTQKSLEIQIEFLELMNTLFCDVNPIPVKEALNLMGFSCGRCRMPLDVLSESAAIKLKQVMKKYELLK